MSTSFPPLRYTILAFLYCMFACVQTATADGDIYYDVVYGDLFQSYAGKHLTWISNGDIGTYAVCATAYCIYNVQSRCYESEQYTFMSSSNHHDGFVTLSSLGVVKSVSVKIFSAKEFGTVTLYARNTPFTSVEDLYSPGIDVCKIGDFPLKALNELSISLDGDCSYVALRFQNVTSVSSIAIGYILPDSILTVSSPLGDSCASHIRSYDLLGRPSYSLNYRNVLVANGRKELR